MGRLHLAIHAALLGVIIWLVITIKGVGPIEGLEQKLRVCGEAFVELGVRAKAAEALSAAVARGEDKSYAENTAVTMPAARRYVERHRVRHEVQSPADSTNAVPGGHGSDAALSELGPGGDSEPMPPGTESDWVAVKDDNIEICTLNYEQAWTGYSVFQRLKEEGLALPVTPTFPEPAFGLERQPEQ